MMILGTCILISTIVILVQFFALTQSTNASWQHCPLLRHPKYGEFIDQVIAKAGELGINNPCTLSQFAKVDCGLVGPDAVGYTVRTQAYTDYPSSNRHGWQYYLTALDGSWTITIENEHYMSAHGKRETLSAWIAHPRGHCIIESLHRYIRTFIYHPTREIVVIMRMTDNNKQLSVLTFNVWGLYISKDRIKRINAIADYLATTDYDVIGLQELWVDHDYGVIAKALKPNYPYTHRFSYGIVGSGLAVFSKHPIKSLHFMPFRLNGKPVNVHHGDWYAGKGVGHAVIEHESIDVDLFITHMIANYHNTNISQKDPYDVHRECQLVDMLNYISQSRTDGNAVIVTGDFNLQPTDPIYDQVVRKGMFLNNRARGLLRSVWDDHHVGGAPDMDRTNSTMDNTKPSRHTFNLPGNSYSKAKKSPECIDHILYDPLKLTCTGLSLELEGMIDKDSLISYSDHCGLAATFTFERSSVHRQHADLVTYDKMSGYYVQKALKYSNDLKNQQSFLQMIGTVAFSMFLGIIFTCSGTSRGYVFGLKLLLLMSFFTLSVLLAFYANLWINFEKNMVDQVIAEWSVYL